MGLWVYEETLTLITACMASLLQGLSYSDVFWSCKFQKKNTQMSDFQQHTITSSPRTYNTPKPCSLSRLQVGRVLMRGEAQAIHDIPLYPADRNLTHTSTPLFQRAAPLPSIAHDSRTSLCLRQAQLRPAFIPFYEQQQSPGVLIAATTSSA